MITIYFCRPRTHQVLLVSQADGSSALWPNGNLQSGNVQMPIVTIPSLAIVPNFVAIHSEQTHATSIVEIPTLPRRTTSLRQYPHKTSPNLSKREIQQHNIRQINANFFETQQNGNNNENQENIRQTTGNTNFCERLTTVERQNSTGFQIDDQKSQNVHQSQNGRKSQNDRQ